METKQSQRKVIAYKKYVSALPKNKVESIIDAKNAYLKYFSYKDAPKYRDEAFKIFKTFNLQIIGKINIGFDDWIIKDILNQNIVKYPYFNCLKESDKEKTYTYLNKNGLSLKTSEGEYYADENFDFQYREFSKYLSQSWREYLKFRNKETIEGFLEDGGMVIFPDEIKSRLLFLDNFIIKHQTFSENEEIKGNIKNYLYYYLNGVDYYPLTDETNKVKLERIKSYENFIKKNKSSKFYPIIFNYYELLRRNKFIIVNPWQNDVIIKFMESNNITYSDTYSPLTGILVTKDFFK